MSNLENILGKSNLLDLSKKLFNVVTGTDDFHEEHEINLDSKILEGKSLVI